MASSYSLRGSDGKTYLVTLIRQKKPTQNSSASSYRAIITALSDGLRDGDFHYNGRYLFTGHYYGEVEEARFILEEFIKAEEHDD